MAKEWILNIATNRWGLNKKEKVGPVSLWIRECEPKSIEDWESFYYKKLSEMLKEKGATLSPQEYLMDIGKKLYVKITEVIQAEIEEVKEEDCIQYIHDLVIYRTYEGYETEIKTIYGQLRRLLKVEIKPAPDEWDRLYNVDFYIEINGKYIGLQIKPISYDRAPEFYKWKESLAEAHKKFEQEVSGKVFIVFSAKKGDKKHILNPEILNEIRNEIEKLSK